MAFEYGNAGGGTGQTMQDQTGLDQPPHTVITAVRLMYAQVAMSIIAVGLLFAMKSEIRNTIEDANRNSSDSSIDHALNLILGIGVGVAVVFTVLYLLLATQVRRGRSWARTTTLVLCGLGVFGIVTGFFQSVPVITRVANLVQLVILIALIVALRRSSDYFFYSRSGRQSGR